MDRNVIESEFRTSKMADSGHFVKNLKKVPYGMLNGQKCDRKVIFGHSKWMPVAIFLKTFTKKVSRVITIFDLTAGRLQLNMNSLLINIIVYTDRYVGNIHCVRPLGRMHTILVVPCFLGCYVFLCIRLVCVLFYYLFLFFFQVFTFMCKQNTEYIKTTQNTYIRIN